MKNLTRQVRGQTQKELVKLFDRLAQRHSRWEVWAFTEGFARAALRWQDQEQERRAS